MIIKVLKRNKSFKDMAKSNLPKPLNIASLLDKEAGCWFNGPVVTMLTVRYGQSKIEPRGKTISSIILE